MVKQQVNANSVVNLINKKNKKVSLISILKLIIFFPDNNFKDFFINSTHIYIL